MVGQVPLYNYGTLFEQDSGVECCDGTSICAGTRYYSQVYGNRLEHILPA